MVRQRERMVIYMLRKIDKISRSKGGFTLIELLVAIVVVGLLGALIMPAIGSSKDRAKEAICVNNLRQLGIAANVFFDEQNGKIPTAMETKRYIDDKRVYICPSDKREGVVVDGDTVLSYETWGPTKWDYTHGSVEKFLMSNTSEQALFVETDKTVGLSTLPQDYPAMPDLMYRHRSGDRLVVLFCDNHALSIGAAQVAATLTMAPGEPEEIVGK